MVLTRHIGADVQLIIQRDSVSSVNGLHKEARRVLEYHDHSDASEQATPAHVLADAVEDNDRTVVARRL